jgi:glycosyltransferase involved in cell wall biosynthesis
VQPSLSIARHTVAAHAKFFSRSGHKFFLTATRLDDLGTTLDLNQKLKLRHRLEALKAAHTTGLVLTEGQSQPALDVAAAAGMVAMVNLTIASADLVDPSRFAALVSRVAHAGNVYRSHPALLGYLIDYPLEADTSAETPCHLALKAVRRRLRALVRILKQHAPNALVAIKHRQATLALALAEEDFLYCSSSSLQKGEVRPRIDSLHRHAGARPVVIEFAQASSGQDEEVAEAFGAGAAGVVAPSVPAPPSRDWLGIRMLRPAETMPFASLDGEGPRHPERCPLVSVVVCARDGERTMLGCLQSLSRLAYPNFEVVIVADGDRARVSEVVAQFPQFRVLRQSNLGLGAARSAGLKAAHGEIVAFVEPDFAVDSHWLTFMVRAMQEGQFDACCGPAYVPHETAKLAACVAVARPSLPSNRFGDAMARSNLAFTKAALRRAGGFERKYKAFDADMDLGRKMEGAGVKLGYCPVALVWNLRRNTLRTFFSRQSSYGRADARLGRWRWDRFGALNQVGRAGVFGYYQRALRTLVALPQSAEWIILWAMAAILARFAGLSPIAALAMLAVGPVLAIFAAWTVPLEEPLHGFAARAMLSFLAFVGPLWRGLMRDWTVVYTHLPSPETVAMRRARIRQRAALRWDSVSGK